MGQQESCLKPRVVEDLMRMTNFSDKELQCWYREFKKDSHNGMISKEEFSRIFEQLFPESNGNEFSNHVFRTFDVNNDGFLNFREFVTGLSLTLKGSFDEKLYWAFKMYDVDGNGFISQSEMKEIIAAMLAMCREKNPDQSYTGEDFFVALDKDNDGQLSWAEFRKGIYGNKIMIKSLRDTLGCVTIS